MILSSADRVVVGEDHHSVHEIKSEGVQPADGERHSVAVATYRKRHECELTVCDTAGRPAELPKISWMSGDDEREGEACA